MSTATMVMSSPATPCVQALTAALTELANLFRACSTRDRMSFTRELTEFLASFVCFDDAVGVEQKAVAVAEAQRAATRNWRTA